MASSRPRPLLLLILDGYGISFINEGNAIAAAKKPNLDRLMQSYPLAAVKAAGIEVGLPWGEMGNSETGHQNIGSGRVLYQALPRISLAIQDGSFFQNQTLLAAIEQVKNNPDARLHTMGVLSNGGVHGHIDHQLALIDLAAQQGVGDRLIIHAFLDGRDSPPDSAGSFLKQLSDKIAATGAGTLSTIIGRYYAMDRAQNWERTKVAYDLLVNGTGTAYPTWEKAATAAYKNADRKSFETAEAMYVSPDGSPPHSIQDGDAVIFYNYRPDRARQLTAAFVQPDFSEFEVTRWQNLRFVTMANYDDTLPADVAFPDEKIQHPLARVFSEHNLKQLRIAEGEKFAHVTYFFNGGRDEEYPGEERIKIPSLTSKDMSEYPEMSAAAITKRMIEELKRNVFDVIVLNYANPDMVAHTGNFDATVKAIECIDTEVQKVIDATLAAGGAVLLTCDHGNAESVINQLTHDNSTDHTNNPVPIVYITPDNKQDPPKSPDIVEQLLSAPIGVLADVAPTVLDILNLPKPEAMTAQSLLKSLA